MEFPSGQFVWFFMVVMTIMWSLRFNRVARNLFLLGASYWFCWQWQPLFLAAIVASSVFNYLIGGRIFDVKDAVRKKRFLVIGLITNLLFLAYFKYYGFFTDNLSELLEVLGLSIHLPVIQVIAPLGVSFYTFQGMAYLVDAHRGKAVRPGSLLDFLLFISFFPQLAAGPICRSHQLLPQIMAPSPPGMPHISRAVTLIATGLFKKMVLGTYLATHMVEESFLDPSAFSALELWLIVFAYTAQIYLDFSGYTDLARGTGLLLGFEIPKNFNYPYCSTNIGDYWRRWHITFSTWLREYIYFPLGGSRCSRMRCYTNLMITFVACGIWHGANWGYIVWGFLHGVGLIAYKASLDLRRDYGLQTDAFPWWRHVLGWAMTIGFCAWVRVFFKAPDMETAWAFCGGLFSGTIAGSGIDLTVLGITILTMALNFVGRPIFEWFNKVHEQMPTRVRPVAWIATALLLFAIRPYGIAPTTYFQF